MTKAKAKNRAAVSLGRRGGMAGVGAAKARSHRLAVEAGKKGAAIRWAKVKGKTAAKGKTTKRTTQAKRKSASSVGK